MRLDATSPGYASLIVLVCAIGMALGAPTFLIYGFGVFIDPLAAAFETGRGAVSLALMIGLLGNLLAGPVVGILADRYGSRRMVLGGIVAFSLILAAHSLIKNVYHFYVLSFAMIVLAAGTGPVTYTRIISAWFSTRRGFALGIALTGIGIGGALAPVASQALISKVGWQLAYVYLAVIVFVISFPPLFFVLRDRPPTIKSSESTQPGAEQSAESGITVREALRQTRFWFLAIGFALIAAGNTGGLVHLPPILTDAGLTPERAALYTGLMGVGVIGGRVFAGYLLDIFHAPYVAIAFLLGPFIAYMFFAAGLNPEWAFLPILLFGIGMGAEFDVIPYLTTRYFGLKNFGAIYGILISAFSIGSGLGPAMMGFGYDRFGDYGPSIMVAMGLLVAGSIFVSRLGAYEFR